MRASVFLPVLASLSILVVLGGCEPADQSIVSRPSSTAQHVPSAQQISSEQHAPPGMVYVPGGTTLIGSETGLPAEQPTFWVEVKPFYMDMHPTTVAQFRDFVEATSHVTQAERFGDA